MEQERRLRERGDREEKVLARLRKAETEEPVGLELADFVVVNDDLGTTIDEMLRIVDGARSRPRRTSARRTATPSSKTRFATRSRSSGR